jgi:nucleoid-associated protein EbfC
MSMMDMMKDLPGMMDRVRKMQDQMKNLRVTGTAGGGMVTVEMNGGGEVTDVRIEPEVVDPEDVEMLQDLIVAAAADAHKNIARTTQEEIGKMTGGIDLSALGIDLPGMGS